MISRFEQWEFKYAPKTFDELIINEELKPKLREVIDTLPSVMLYGTHGVGKGSFANILLDETNLKTTGSMWINGSDDTGIDVFRDKIKPFATSMGFTDMKVVVLNEGDSLTAGPQGSQKMLRQLMEDVQASCRFILLCNYDNLIIPELKSRFRVIKVDNPPIKQIANFCLKILKKENVKFKKEAFFSIIKKCYPDIRSTINVLQLNTVKGELKTDYTTQSEETFESILTSVLYDGQDCIPKVRGILRNNYIPYDELYGYFYNNVEKFEEPALAIMSIGKHLHWNSTIAIKEVCFMRMVVQMLNTGVVKV